MPRSNYINQFQGSFSGILRWQQLDDFWAQLKNNSEQWYVYQIDEAVPLNKLSQEKFNAFIDHLNDLLHSEHDEKYCGVVYVDNIEKPNFIKIFDPNNLGTGCGIGKSQIRLPGWTISKSQPIDLKQQFPSPQNRKRWWQSFFK